MKKVVKSTISFFRLLIEHSQREYEPSPEHILKRMLNPFWHNFWGETSEVSETSEVCRKAALE